MTVLESNRVLNSTPSGFSKEEIAAAVEDVRKVTILKTLWYPKIVDALEESARAYLKYFGIEEGEVTTLGVPGSYELPLAVLQQARLGRTAPEFVIALGCVVRGETPHFDFVCSAVSQGLMDVQLQTEIPVGFGVLTVDNIRQAEARLEKGSEAAQAAFFMYLRGWQCRRQSDKNTRKESEL